jgi:hypothetical protein
MTTDERLHWFKCVPSKLLGALAGMTPDQQLVYLVTLLRIYEVRGPCLDTPAVLARRIGINTARVQKALEALYSMPNKLTTSDRGISNDYAERSMREGEEQHQLRVRAGGEGGRTTAKKRKQKQSDPVSKADSPLKQSGTESESEGFLFPPEKAPKADSSRETKAPPLDIEADLYRRGREVLGQQSGGMITQLLRAKGGNHALARAAIEEASTRGVPREYVGAMIRKKGGGAARNGFAELSQRLEEQFQEEIHEQATDRGIIDIPALPAPSTRGH